MKHPKIDTPQTKKSFFEYFFEILGWLQIVFSPLTIGTILGAVYYVANPNSTRFVLGIVIAAVGLIVGIIWATWVWRNEGTTHYVSRIMATPELDTDDDEKK